VATDAALARILGVGRTAIVKAERTGKIARTADGKWDAGREEADPGRYWIRVRACLTALG
jgi:hypothetical protein